MSLNCGRIKFHILPNLPKQCQNGWTMVPFKRSSVSSALDLKFAKQPKTYHIQKAHSHICAGAVSCTVYCCLQAVPRTSFAATSSTTQLLVSEAAL